jgi:hypothetical protein
LTPSGNTIDRKLTFHREDGTDTNGVPKYQDFPADELAAIARVYPRGSVKADGKRHVAQAQFANSMPSDVGGAGSWTNITSSLGSAAVYMERFRGNDDFATNVEQKLEAVNQLTDLIIAWSRVEMGKEAGYESFRQFLDSPVSGFELSTRPQEFCHLFLGARHRHQRQSQVRSGISDSFRAISPGTRLCKVGAVARVFSDCQP